MDGKDEKRLLFMPADALETRQASTGFGCCQIHGGSADTGVYAKHINHARLHVVVEGQAFRERK
jgi:hypothetical protein